ncbi:MAG: hypothetical protein RCG15_04980 [Candidatus Rickettsia vulgarisii]
MQDYVKFSNISYNKDNQNNKKPNKQTILAEEKLKDKLLLKI